MFRAQQLLPTCAETGLPITRSHKHTGTGIMYARCPTSVHDSLTECGY